MLWLLHKHTVTVVPAPDQRDDIPSAAAVLAILQATRRDRHASSVAEVAGDEVRLDVPQLLGHRRL